MSGVLKLGSVTLGTENSGKVDLTNVGAASADSVTATITNLPSSLTALDTSASNGATSNADNTALPLFGCRAWVRFHGTTVTSVNSENHCLIFGSGNISKVVRSGDGRYEVYFQTPMPDTNYAAVVTREAMGAAGGKIYAYPPFETAYVQVLGYDQNGAYQNVGHISCIIMR